MDSSVDERENPSTGQAAQHQDDVVMEEADELPRADLSYVAQERDNELDPNTKNGSSHHVQDEHDSEEPLGAESQNERGLESQPSAKSRRFPIEIVLNPPTDPSAYQRIEPSQTVERILEEIELDGDIFYSVEFDDGRIEQVAYDDLLEMENGRRASLQYQTERLYLETPADGRAGSKRPLPEDEYEASEDDNSDRSKKRQKTLSTRATRRSTRATSKKVQAQDESEDELARTLPVHEDEDDYVIPLVRSDIRGATRTSSRRKRQPKRASYTSSLKLDLDSDIEFEQPSRRSTRSNRAAKNMRDPDLDDEYEAVETKLSAPKAAAVKETFEDVPQESAFGQVHSAVCDTCANEADSVKGQLIFCQGCSYSYHKACIGIRSHREHRVTKVSPNYFVLQCRFCIRSQKKDPKAPNYSMCQVCKLTGASCAEFSAKRSTKQEEKARLDNGGIDPITDVQADLLNNPDNVLFRCSTCRRAYHFEHLPPIAADRANGMNIPSKRVAEYSSAEWKCRECQEAAQRIHALVAWRPTDRTSRSELVAEEFNCDQIEYLVKWEGKSHHHDQWMPGAWVYGVAAPAMRIAFHKREGSKMPKMTLEEAVEKEWLLVDVILHVEYKSSGGGLPEASKSSDLARISDIKSAYVKFQGLSYEEAVWDDPPPSGSGALWAAFRAAYEEYLNGKYFPRDNGMRERIKHYRSLDFKKECELQDQPPSLKKSRSLMRYQIEGVNWLLYHFHQQQNVILADEMGLGKTIQIVAFISSLVLDQPKCWPFLIVVPNATCPNWRRELRDWAPGLRVVTYHGGKAAQDLAYTYELFPYGAKAGMKAHVVIMSYEAASNLKGVFNAVKWAGLIVDEGQRLKNEETQLYKSLLDQDIPCRILLTGTPLQNNRRELFNLLQFLDLKNDAARLDEEYAELTEENLPELHNLIRPYFLRRTKAQVLKFLPPMAQIIVPVTMTSLQETVYKGILTRRTDLIKAILSNGTVRKSDRASLSNIVADLRQCVCHPYCFDARIEQHDDVDEQQKRLKFVEASAKLKLLEIMLPKLQERGHRVLIFSQFLRCLDILEDFLTDLGLPYGRIDGKQSALEKQNSIDAFNAPDSPLFAMLLSTRAGGVGINLATADTVIIYDPDWNPHQDIQAISRAHRIGQKNKVLCIKLITKDTVDEDILEAGMKKLALNRTLIDTLDAEGETAHDYGSILRRGAEALFRETDKAKITYDSASVDKLLDRSRLDNSLADGEATAETQFSVARVWDSTSNELTANNTTIGSDEATPADASVWDRILENRMNEYEQERKANEEKLGRGARRRGTKVNYSNGVGFIEGVNDVDDDVLTEVKLPEPDSAGSDAEDEDELYIDNGEEENGEEENGDEEGEEDVPDQEDGQTMAPAKGKGSRANQQNRGPPILPPPPPKPSSLSYTPASVAPSSHLQPPPQHNLTYRPQPKSHDTLAVQPPSLMWKPFTPFPPSSNAAPTLTQTPQVIRPQMTTVPSNISRLNEPALGMNLTLKTTSPPTFIHPTPAWPTGEGGACLICGKPHPWHTTCVNMDSEYSIRLAIDSLRAHPNSPAVQSVRKSLVERLRILPLLRQ